MTEQNTETVDTDEQETKQPDESTEGAQGKPGGQVEGTGEPEPESFSREYVEKLRKEAADARVRAKQTDALTQALWTARVAATGRLADPTDLVMPEGADPMDDDALTEAVDTLLGSKPHLASRRPVGAIGQGATATAESVDLAGLLRSRA